MVLHGEPVDNGGDFSAIDHLHLCRLVRVFEERLCASALGSGIVEIEMAKFERGGEVLMGKGWKLDVLVDLTLK